ncbi:MAG: hypothetical protein Q7V58_07680 [Actinomycetota bacterium]|nr:hypothetical protein [Actinomycetota bacterium]
MSINVTLDRVATPIERGVFEALFEQSVVSGYAAVRNSLKTGSISFTELVKMARKAEIPYPLFFAPRDVVDEQLRLKRKRLLTGFSSRREFAMNSRSRVELSQVELLVKNLQFKQDYIKKDKTLGKNAIVNLLKKPGASVEQDAAKLMAALKLLPAELRGTKNKGDALDVLVDKLEAQNVLVAQSAKDYMPQQMPKGAIFSGMTLRDGKVPFIFIASGDDGEKFEPTGRRVFTLTLLAVLVARGRFATVTYNGHTTDETSMREYELTAEILMPAADFQRANIRDLEAIRAASDVYKVTPSAVVMRAQRLKLLTRDEAETHLIALKDAYDKADKTPRRSMLPMNALKRYNGRECSRRMLALFDSNGISTSDFCRVMFSNTYRGERAINDFRAAIS